jgi:O-antigen ligase
VAFVVWLIAATTVRRRWRVYGLAACLLLAPAATAVIGLVQFATGDGPPTFRIAPDLPFVRAYGTIGQPNSFAGYMNMAWPIALALSTLATAQLLRPRTTDQRPTTDTSQDRWHLLTHWSMTIGLWSITTLLLAALAASFSRGAWLGALAGALGMAAALGRRWALAAGALLAAGVLGMALGGAGLLPAPLAARVASISRSVAIFDAEAVAVTPENFAVVERMAHLQAGWRMLRERPLLGVGPGNYSVVYPRVAVGEWYASRGHAHNYYLHMAAEAGIVSLAAYLALVGAVVARGYRLARHASDPFSRALAVGCCGMIAAVSGHNLFENLHVLNMGIQIAAAWALLEAR